MATLKTVPTQKKYGLQIRGGSSSGGHGNVKKSSTPAAFFRSALEEDDEEEEEEKEEDNSRGSRYGNKSANKLQSQKVIQRANKEIMQNSSNISLDSLTEEERQIYDYDASYDDFKSKEQEKFGKSMNLLGKNEPPVCYYTF